MRYFILILLLLNVIAIENVFARKYDNDDDDDDDQPIARRRNERLKLSEDNNIERRQRSDVSSKNTKFSTKFDKTDLDNDKRRATKKSFDEDDRVSKRKLINTREETRPEAKRRNVRGESAKHNKQEERRAPKVTNIRRQKDVKIQQRRQPIRQGGRKSAKHISDDTDEDDDDDDTDEDDDDDDDDDDDETDEDDDDDDTDEDDDDNDTDEDNDDTDEDDDNTDEDDDDSFEMITYKDKKKPTFLQRLKGKKNEKPKKQLSYRKKVYKELGLVDDDDKHVSSEEVPVRAKKYSKKYIKDCDSMEEDCP